MRPKYLYRARVVSYPAGSHITRIAWGDRFECPINGWAPPGWVPSQEYIDRFGTTEFFWPKDCVEYKSRSSAKRRAELFESFGATAVVERSSRITWPEGSES